MRTLFQPWRGLLLVLALCAVLTAWWLHASEPLRSSGDALPASAEHQPEIEAVLDPHARGMRRAGGSDTGEGPGPALSSASSPDTGVIVTGGVAYLKSQTPVPWVDVIFSRRGAEWTATSDDAGQYSVALVPGRYQVRAFGDRVMAIGLPILALGREAQTYDVSVIAHSVIRGQARYQDGSKAAGAIVVPVPQDDRRSASGATARGELGSAEVQADGSFELFTLPGNLLLHAGNDAASGSVPVLALKAGAEREDVQIVLVPNGFIAGTVRGPKGALIDGARVLASVQIPGTGEYDRVPIKTDDQGRFKWQVLRPAHTIVEAAADGYAQASPQAFTLDPGEHREGIELILHDATHSLVGHVFDASGEPLAYVEVAQGQEGSKERYKKAFTNADGRFEISALGPGPHRLRTRKAGYEQMRLQQVTAPATDLRIVMPAQAAAE